MTETLTMDERHNRELNMPTRATAIGLVLIALTGLIHLVEAPEYWGEVRYVGALFGLTAAGAVLAAVGIMRGERWGWLLGSLIAVSNAVGYVASRTIGIPRFRENSWDTFLEPIGIASLVVELLFIILAVQALSYLRATRS